jgi:hypothetical protein
MRKSAGLKSPDGDSMTATIEKNRKFDYTDVLLWFSIISLTLWIIGKLFGWI